MATLRTNKERVNWTFFSFTLIVRILLRINLEVLFDTKGFKASHTLG